MLTNLFNQLTIYKITVISVSKWHTSAAFIHSFSTARGDFFGSAKRQQSSAFSAGRRFAPSGAVATAARP
jgi:hypothetical protein